jgi:membrane fusion protein, multidrug efflux system
LVLLIAPGLLAVLTLRWSRWEGRPGWRQSDDAYLQADQTPILARAAGYLRAAPVQDQVAVFKALGGGWRSGTSGRR